MRSLYSYCSLPSTIGLLIILTLVDSTILILRPLSKSNNNPYKIGWNKIHPDLFKKNAKKKLPYLWVMTTNSHPQGKLILSAYINNKDLQNEINKKTIPIWTDLLLEEEHGHFFLPIRRNFINLDPLCQVWMFYPDGKLMATWIPNKSTSESISLSLADWVKKNTSLKTFDLTLNALHEQDIVLVKQKTHIGLSYLDQQYSNADQTLKQFENLEKIPITMCLYGLEVGLDQPVKDIVKRFFFTPLYNPLEHIFRNSYRWNFLWKKVFVDFSYYPEQNAEIYFLLCKIHKRYPKEGYDLLAKTLFNGMKKEFWQKDGFINVREGMEDERGISPYESFSLRELYENFSVEEQKELDKNWNLFNSLNIQRIPIQQTSELNNHLYLSLKKIHPYPISPYISKNKTRQLRIFSCLLRGSRLLKDMEAYKWCLDKSKKNVMMSYLNQKPSNNFDDFNILSQLDNWLSLSDFYLQLFKSTKDKKFYALGLKTVKKVCDNLNRIHFINSSLFLIAHYLPTQNVLSESTANKLTRLLWSYGGKEKKMFPVKQVLIDNILLQNSVYSRIPSNNYFYLLEHILRYQGKNSFKCQVKCKILENINHSIARY